MQLGYKLTYGKSEKELPTPTQIEVKEKLGEPISYALTFSEDICDADLLLLCHPGLNPLVEVTVTITPEGGDEVVLVKGPVLRQQVNLVHGGKGSKLTVSGADNSVKLGWKTETKNWGKTITREEIKQIIQNPTHHFEIVNVLTANDKGSEKANKPANDNSVVKTLKDRQVQREPDLSFLKKLANQMGAYFWISYNEAKKEVANFEELPLGKSVDEDLMLIINLDNNNIDEFTINWDADRPTTVKHQELDIGTKDVRKGNREEPPQKKLGEVTLKDVTSGVYSALLTTPGVDTSKMLDRSKAALNESEWFIKGSCTLNYDRQCNGKIFHAHTKVLVKGAGSRHEGEYIISGATHTIDSTSYKVQLDLMRNAWNKTSETEPKSPENKPKQKGISSGNASTSSPVKQF